MDQNPPEGTAWRRKVREGFFREGWVKILFHLEQDDDGYPPYSVESLWARPVDDGYQLDNIPFFTRGVSAGDVVAVDADEDGALVFRSVVRPSGHSTVRVFVRDPAETSAVREHLRVLGCTSEGSGIPGLVSVDVPKEVDYRLVRRYLEDGAAGQHWDYEEAALADHIPDD